MAIISTYLGEIDEDKILNMTLVHYNSVLRELGFKIQYEAIANLYGNSYCENPGDIIEKRNPLSMDIDGESQGGNKRLTLGMLKQMGIAK